MESVVEPGTSPDGTTGDTQAPGPASRSGKPMFDLIELLFFAYRDFVADADRMLEAIGFGRAHHRVLHFVNRHPGLTIAELLDILRITKQSLNRVLKELLEQGYVESRPGEHDRRQRHLYPAAKGRNLARELAMVQTRRFSTALEGLPEGAREHAIEFLLAMIDAGERERVEQLVWSDRRPQVRKD